MNARALWLGRLTWMVCLVAGSSNAWSQVRGIDVARDGDAYVVNVQVFAPVNRQIAWDVLTDFPNMAKWAPNLKESLVVKPDDRQMTIEQRGTASFGGVGFSTFQARIAKMRGSGSLHGPS